MLKTIALSLALLGAPTLSLALEATPVPQKKAAVKVQKPKKPAKAAKPAMHDHAEESWICNTFHDNPPHTCTFKDKKPGKCKWCGMHLVKAGSKEDSERLAKVKK